MGNSVSKPLIVGVGNTFINCYGVVNREFMQQYDLNYQDEGDLTPDQCLLFDGLKEQESYCEIPGGTTMNTLRWINHVMKNSYNIDNSTTFYGWVSNDDSGQKIKNFLDSEGIFNFLDEHDVSYTGKWAVVIINSERYVIANMGVNTLIRTQIFTDNISSVHNCKILLSETFNLHWNKELTIEVCKFAHANNKLFAFCLGGEFYIKHHREDIEEVIPYCDIIFGNIDELRCYLKIGTQDSTELTDSCFNNSTKSQAIEDLVKELAMVPKLNKRQNRIVLISNGKNGAYFDNYNFETDEHETLFAPSVDLEQTKVVDTCCAGDSFAGGFLAGILSNKSYLESIRIGHKMASIVIQSVGCQYEL